MVKFNFHRSHIDNIQVTHYQYTSNKMEIAVFKLNADSDSKLTDC